MDVVDFWEKQVALWNEQGKCGFCWSFGAPLVESAIELQQIEEDSKCCVQVLLTQDKVDPFATSNTYDQLTGLLTRSVCTMSFQILFLVPDVIGKNNHNEIAGHSITEGKWSETLSRLQQCIACDANLAFCEIVGRSYWVTQWRAKQELNFTANNYSGYRLTVSIQKVI